MVEAESLGCAFSGSLQQIESIATKIEQRLRQETAQPDALPEEFLKKCVAMLGGAIRVSRSSLGTDDPSGSLVIAPDGKFQIVLSPYTSPLRDTFTVAHELGHLFLHYYPLVRERQLEFYVVFQRNGTGLLEKQANRFAASLLMPREPFTTAVRSLGDDYSVAAKFGVSVAAVKSRKASLGI